MFSCIFLWLEIFRRCSKIFRDLERSSKVKNTFEDFSETFQRYCKDIYFFTEMSKPKTFKNLFKIFMKIFENLGMVAAPPPNFRGDLKISDQNN